MTDRRKIIEELEDINKMINTLNKQIISKQQPSVFDDLLTFRRKRLHSAEIKSMARMRLKKRFNDKLELLKFEL